MNLSVWQKAMELYKYTWEMFVDKPTIDFKLKSQILNSTQSISSNISEGYSRRTINDYIRFLYIALGSCSESLTRAIGFFEVNLITKKHFDSFETLHFEVENKLLGLIRSLEKKKDGKIWVDSIAEEQIEYCKGEIE